MRAIQIQAYGLPLEAVRYVTDMPEPKALGVDDVLLSVQFAPINFNDLYVMGGQFPHKPSLGDALGNEAVGRVLAVGESVETVSVGDLVVPPLYSGTWRERMVVPSQGLFPLPQQADLMQLAMLRINPPTAGLLLSQFVDLKPGDWIIQNAGNSGVGRSVIAFAREDGFRTISIVRRESLVNELTKAGADAVLTYESATPARIKSLVGVGLAPLGLDGISHGATEQLAGLLSPEGTLVSYARMGRTTEAPADLRPLLSKGINLRSFYQNRPQYKSKVGPVLQRAAALVASGAIYTPVAATYKLSEIEDALAHVQRGGKVLLDVQSV